MRSRNFLLSFGIFLFVASFISAAVPNPGHGISDFVSPGENFCGGKVLKWVGLATTGHWECADLPSGSGGSSEWSSDANGIYYSPAGKGVGIGDTLAGIESNSILGVYANGKSYGIFAKASESSGNAIKAENYNGQHLGYLGARDYGVYGETSDASHSAIKGVNTNKNTEGTLGGNIYGAYGKKGNNYGYLGGQDYGAYGRNSNGNYGYLGGGSYGVYGYSSSGYAGYFNGRVKINQYLFLNPQSIPGELCNDAHGGAIYIQNECEGVGGLCGSEGYGPDKYALYLCTGNNGWKKVSMTLT